MPTSLLWILASGLLMTAFALVGGTLVLLPERTQQRLTGLLVAFSAGSLLGGALFHLFPAAHHELGGGARPWIWLLAGIGTFFALETLLRSRHHHEHAGHSHPVVWLILLADALHSLVGGLAVGSAILLDPRLGAVVWVAEAAHEVPQELGDFAILVAHGFTWRRALVLNFVSGLSFLVGGVLAWWFSAGLDLAFLLAFGAGNFLYLAIVDLLPEVLRRPDRQVHILAVLTGFFGLALLRLALPDLHPH